MNPQINLAETRKSRPRWSALSSSVVSTLTGRYRMKQFNHSLILPSRPTATVTPSGCVKLFNKVQHEPSDFVPAHPDRLPGAGRITRKIYGWGGLAESRNLPLIKILSFAERVSLCLKKEVCKMHTRVFQRHLNKKMKKLVLISFSYTGPVVFLVLFAHHFNLMLKKTKT